ncbi:hypothetical protein QOZ80_9AG0690010 [Eleusine coracana subsp. coracana]|nr:hypothetical protein QOZ80_9AG0690010 [Eleusine coracana subsp. coracana]
MAEKISMLIVKVDLDCHKCYEKMRKILCKLQDQERIRTISYDDKSKTIAIAGPFDPQRLACKIRCRGGKTVKDVQIIDVVGDGPPPPGNNNNGKNKKHKEKLPPPAAEQPPPPPQPSSPPPEPAAPSEIPRPSSPPPPQQQPATPDRGMVSTMPAFHEEDRSMPPPPPSPKGNPHHPPPPTEYYAPPPQASPPMMNPRPLAPPMPCPTTKPAPEPYPSECVIPTVEIPSWPAAPVGPCGCPCCRPCYQGYFEGCRCGCAGNGARVYAGPPPPVWCGYGPYGYRGCRIINEEDPNAACTIM